VAQVASAEVVKAVAAEETEGMTPVANWMRRESMRRVLEGLSGRLAELSTPLKRRYSTMTSLVTRRIA